MEAHIEERDRMKLDNMIRKKDYREQVPAIVNMKKNIKVYLEFSFEVIVYALRTL